MTAHVIRLRGPWQVRPLARTVLVAGGSTEETPGPLPPAGRSEVPSDWGDALGRDFRGRVRYLRRFGCPTGLGEQDRVELVVERVDAFGAVWLNSQSLGPIPAGGRAVRFDITARLQPRNELVLQVELPALIAGSPPLARPGREGLPGGLIGEVRLEIVVPEAGSADDSSPSKTGTAP
jgi:hypothetical protein